MVVIELENYSKCPQGRFTPVDDTIPWFNLCARGLRSRFGVKAFRVRMSVDIAKFDGATRVRLQNSPGDCFIGYKIHWWHAWNILPGFCTEVLYRHFDCVPKQIYVKFEEVDDPDGKENEPSA